MCMWGGGRCECVEEGGVNVGRREVCECGERRVREEGRLCMWGVKG